jgi:PKD repeat protein
MPALLAYGSGHVTYLIDGSTGGFVWNAYVADKPAMVERIDDITWDGINDVVVGTLYTDNYWYFLDGVDGTTIQSGPYSSPIDAITTIPDIVGDSSMELIVGGRYGYVTCHSGGLQTKIIANFSADTTQGPAPLTVHFLDESSAENTTINSWKWDFDNDGTIDSNEQNPTWIYEQDGTYTVSLTVSDGVASDTETKENFITVFPMENMLTIANISGGLLKITAEIQNPSSMEVTDVNWSISLNGGLILLGKQKSNSFQSIAPRDSVLIADRPIIGIGKVNITITVEAPDIQPVTKTANGFVFLFFIIIR